MRKLFIAAAAIALLGPALAHAQPGDRGDRGDRGGGRGRDGGQFQAPRNPQGPNPQAQAPQAGPPQAPPPQGGRFQNDQRGQGAFGDRGQFRGRGDQNAQPQQPQVPQAQQQQGQRFDRGQNRQAFQGGGPQDRRFDGGRDDNRFNGPDRRFDNGRADGRRFDDNRRFDNNRGYARGGSYNYRGRTFDRFRAQPYRWPGGFRGAFNWLPNQYLPTSFLLRDYYIDNYWDFGFGRPPYGYEWIRVGDDALLVNIYTGQIADVAPGVFYW